jgi:aminoglycoside 6'-N-acetyltransferase
MLPIRDGDLTIRPMRDDADDYRLLVRWRAEPHVHEWWDPDDPPPTLDEVIAHYGPRVRGEEKTTACIFLLDDRPAGFIQFYRWLPYTQPSTPEEPVIDIRPDEDTFGLDIHIGEPDLVGHGLGTRVVDVVCGYLERQLGASWVALTTEVTNHRAQRAYEKAGFRKVRQVLDTDTRGGQPAVCWLMERHPR